MSSTFALPDVSPEHILGVARLAATRDANSPTSEIGRDAVVKALDISEVLAQRAIVAAQQLDFVRPTPTGWAFSGDGEIRHAKKSDLLSLPRYPGHLDCGDEVAQKGVQDGHTIPGRVPRAGGGVSAAA